MYGNADIDSATRRVVAPPRALVERRYPGMRAGLTGAFRLGHTPHLLLQGRQSQHVADMIFSERLAGRSVVRADVPRSLMAKAASA